MGRLGSDAVEMLGEISSEVQPGEVKEKSKLARLENDSRDIGKQIKIMSSNGTRQLQMKASKSILRNISTAAIIIARICVPPLLQSLFT